MGLPHNLRLLKAKGIQNCIVEGDSKTVINWGRGDRGFLAAASLHERDQSFGYSSKGQHSACS